VYLDKEAEDLTKRAEQLGAEDHFDDSQENKTNSSRQAIPMHSINADTAREYLNGLQPPSLDQDINTTIATTNNLLHTCAMQCRKQETPNADGGQARRKNILESDDPKKLWKAINWNGCMQEARIESRPGDHAFKQHCEKLLSPDTTIAIPPTHSLNRGLYIPITDDPISTQEVEKAIRTLKSNKSGVPPGLLKLLPPKWMPFIAQLLSGIFLQPQYPQTWRGTKLAMLFKKGDRMICDNYRGISLMDTLAKLLDVILNRRLSAWFAPDKEQSGAQKKTRL
jgi:hypothetical protein